MQEDSQELFESLDEQNDMAAAEASDDMEALTEEDLEMEPAPEAETEPEIHHCKGKGFFPVFPDPEKRYVAG